MPKILAIADINDNLISLKAIINEAFPEGVLLTTLNGAKGIELAISSNPDVILLDIIMPGMDGFEVCSLLKQDERVSDIPVVFLTALKGDKENRIKALEVGAEGFLSKPIDETELTAQIRAMVKIKAASEQKRDEKERLKEMVEERTKELLQSQAQLKGIFENLQDAYFQVNISGHFTVVSPSAIKMYGFESTEEIIGLKADQFYANPLDRNSLMSILHSTGRVEDYVCQAKKKDGANFWVSMNVQLIRNGEGQIIGTEGVVRDISERIKADRAHKESEERFQTLFNKAPLGYQSLDFDGHFIEVNQQWLNTLGYTREEVIGKWFGDFLAPEYRDGFRKRFPMFKSLGQIHSEFEMVHKDGTKLFIAFEGKIGYDLNGDFKQTHCILQDVTESRRSEKDIQESEEKYRTMVDLLPDAVIIHEGGKFVFANAAALKTIGANSFDQLIERPLMAYVHPDFRNVSLSRIQKIYSSGQPSTFSEEKFITLKDEIIDVEVIGIPVSYMGKPAIQAIIRDISERKQASEALKNSLSLTESTLESIHNGILVVDHEGRVIKTSSRFVEMWQIPEEILRSGDDKTLMNSILNQLKDPDEFVSKVMELYAKPETVSTEIIYFKDGRIFERVSKPMYLEGKPKGRVWSFLDITKQKKSELALKESVQLFQGLFNASPDAIVLIDPNHPSCLWPIVDCNEASCRMNGYTREEMIGQSIDLLNITPEKPEDQATYHNELKQKGIIHMETSHRHKDGHIFPIEVSTSIIVIGGREMVLGIDRDITERKQANMALKESEDRYRSFISQVSEGVYRFECDQPIDISLPIEEQVDFIYDHMFIAECNDAFLKIYGIKDRSDLIGKSHLYFHGSRNNPVNRGALVAFIKNGYHIENAMTEELNHRGQMIYISHNSLGIIDNNQLVRIWGTQIDITEKIRADRVQQVLYTISNATFTSNDLPELIEIISNELALLLDSTNFFIAFYDESSKMLSTVFEKGDRDKIDTWPAEKSLTGYVIKHQKSVLANEADINKLCESGEIEIVGIASKIWMGVPLSVNKKVIGAIVVQSYDNPDAFTEKEKLMLEFVSHQISTSIERKKIEQELKLMGKAFDQSPVTIVITDKDGHIEYTNPKFSETTGYTSEEVKGKNPRVLQSGSQSKVYYQELWETILKGNDWFGEFQNKRKNGEIYWESAVISPITNESGDVAFFMAIKEEITEKKKMISDLIQARNKAEESDRLKSAFLANMSHEIRTPLNSIIGFSELMADPGFDPGQQTEFAQIIINSGNSLLSIISDIMDFSKIEAGQVIVNKFPFVTQKLISELLREYSIVAQGKGIELRSDFLNPKEDIWIRSDEYRLKQVLVNLVSNALKFTKEGYVELGIEATGDFIQFRVSDTGIGIPEEYHNEIFERFRQVESSNSRNYGGNGLGLAISKSLVEMMGGEIWIESVQGKGSTFYFTIPIGLITT